MSSSPEDLGFWALTLHSTHLGLLATEFELIFRSKEQTENVGLGEERMSDVGRLKGTGLPCRKYGPSRVWSCDPHFLVLNCLPFLGIRDSLR